VATPGGWFDSAPGTPVGGSGGAGAGLLRGLLAADRLRLRRRIRLVHLGGGVDLGEVDVGGRFGAHIALADDRRDHRLDLLDDVLLHLLDVFQLVRVELLAARSALVSDSRLPFWSTTVTLPPAGSSGTEDATRCTMALTWPGRGAARLQVEQHGGGRLLLLAHEHGRFRQRQVHARRLTAERLDRARQFAFERALVVDLFEELRHAQLLVFHQLEADVAAFRQALRGQLQAHVGTCSAGTRIAVPPSENLYLTPIWSSEAVIAPPSRSL
jgi:hypothetical protein